MSHNPYYYIGPNPTADLIVMNPDFKILLILRPETSPACPNQWALPGGFVDTVSKKHEHWVESYETPRVAAIREVKEETNLDLDDSIIVHPVGVYEGNQRDPRDNDESWSKSHAFFYMIDASTYEQQKHNLVGMERTEETNGVGWFSLEEIAKMDLAFDHRKIIEDALQLYFYNSHTSKTKLSV